MNFIKTSIGLFLFALLLCSFKKNNNNVTWVAIGDSFTYLNDNTYQTGFRVTKGYMTDVAAHFDGLNYINQGYNGAASSDIAGMIDKLGFVKADIYTILLGTNDWWRGLPLGKLDDYINNTGNATVYGSFRIIINKIYQLNPQAKILLITPQ